MTVGPPRFNSCSKQEAAMIRDWLEDDEDDETPPNGPEDNPDEFL